MATLGKAQLMRQERRWRSLWISGFATWANQQLIEAFLHYDDMRTGREENLGGRLRILPVRYKSEMLLLLTQHDVCRSCKRTYRYFEE